MNLQRVRPETKEDLLKSLYQGTICHLPATPLTRELIADVSAAISSTLGDDFRHAQFRLEPPEFFDRVGSLRKRFYTEARYHFWIGRLLDEFGFEIERIAFDPLRLRLVMHKGHDDPRAAPIYYAHRDTWYAHSQAEITWWIPLHDVEEDETFVFYPDWFDRPVSNNSEIFDYADWVSRGTSLRIGWQNRDHGLIAAYPGHTGPLEPGREITFAANAGDIVLFSGSHFHQTRKQATGRSRFSLDFRSVDLVDHAGNIGAPNVDNRSTGDAVVDYIRLS